MSLCHSTKISLIFCLSRAPSLRFRNVRNSSIVFYRLRHFLRRNAEALRIPLTFPRWCANAHGLSMRRNWRNGEEIPVAVSPSSNFEKSQDFGKSLTFFNAWHKPCLLTLLKGLLEANGNVGLISDSRPSHRIYAQSSVHAHNEGDAFRHSLNDIMIHRGDMIATVLSKRHWEIAI